MLKDCVVQIYSSYLYLLKRRNLIGMCCCMLDHKIRSIVSERGYVTINVYLIISLIECFDIGLVEFFSVKTPSHTFYEGKLMIKKKYVIYHDKRYDF